MKTILAFAGSNSSKSINQQLVKYTASLIEDHSFKIVDLRDYPAPVYSIDIEEKGEFPPTMIDLNKLFSECDGFILSSPEYNGSIPPALKNTIDWISRIERPTFKGKPMLLMSTSPGERGGRTNLEYLKSKMPRWGANVISTYSLPHFEQNMELISSKLINIEEKKKLDFALETFLEALK